MSLISQDFRTKQALTPHKGHFRLRWVFIAIAGAGIGTVIANTNTSANTSANTSVNISASTAINKAGVDDININRITLTELPEFKTSSQSSNKSSNRTASEELARESFSLSLPELQARQEILDDSNNLTPKQWSEYTVKSGDNLALLFKRANLKAKQLDELMKSGDEAKTLTKIFPKDVIRILSDDEGELQALRYDIDKKSYLMVERENGVLIPKTYSHETETRQAHASGMIDSSLYLAAQDAGISQNIIMELAGIFGWDIDFALDIRKGDSFTVLYEELYQNGEKVSDGDILAAEFVNDGKTYRAIRYTNPQTNATEYFSPDGKSLKKAFLRTPVNFARISSRFTVNRYHPVLHKFRSHKGVDYAAKTGTPVYSAGDGKVIFKGKKGGYGKVMIVKHGTKYTTLYAHLNSYSNKFKVGSKVKQGQTIAYVGKSGLATGPHLHYEFRVNGVHRNPLTVKLPESSPVPTRYMADFELTTTPILSQLDLLSRTQQVAFADAI